MFVPFAVHDWVIVGQSESKVFLFRRSVVLALLILGLSYAISAIRSMIYDVVIFIECTGYL